MAKYLTCKKVIPLLRPNISVKEFTRMQQARSQEITLLNSKNQWKLIDDSNWLGKRSNSPEYNNPQGNE